MVVLQSRDMPNVHTHTIHGNVRHAQSQDSRFISRRVRARGNFTRDSTLTLVYAANPVTDILYLWKGSFAGVFRAVPQ